MATFKSEDPDGDLLGLGLTINYMLLASKYYMCIIAKYHGLKDLQRFIKFLYSNKLCKNNLIYLYLRSIKIFKEPIINTQFYNKNFSLEKIFLMIICL